MSSDNRSTHRFEMGGTMQLVFVVILLISGLTPLAWSAEFTSDSSTLTVSGEGIVRISPDTAIIRLAVETAGKSFDQVQQDNASAMRRVFDELLKIGIERERIQTTSFDVTPRYAQRPRPRSQAPNESQTPKIIGYTARNSLKVEMRKLEAVGKVVDKALHAGANRFSGINWVLREKDSVYRQALQQAAEEARNKATTLAQSLNVTLVRLAKVQEGGRQVYPQARALAGAQFSMAESAKAVPMAPGEIQVQATVTLVFEIGSPAGHTNCQNPVRPH